MRGVLSPLAGKTISCSFAGGLNAGAQSEIDGIRFDTEATINPASTLSIVRDGLAGVNSATNDYFAGSSGTSTAFDGLQFATETSFIPGATLVARFTPAGVNSTARGYFGGGYMLAFLSEIDGIRFDTEAAINPAATLAAGRNALAGVQSGAL